MQFSIYEHSTEGKLSKRRAVPRNGVNNYSAHWNINTKSSIVKTKPRAKKYVAKEQPGSQSFNECSLPKSQSQNSPILSPEVLNALLEDLENLRQVHLSGIPLISSVVGSKLSTDVAWNSNSQSHSCFCPVAFSSPNF